MSKKEIEKIRKSGEIHIYYGKVDPSIIHIILPYFYNLK